MPTDWDYSKIQYPCFVCKVEDQLGQPRGTQSHPINCGWKIEREHQIRTKALEQIINATYRHQLGVELTTQEYSNILTEIKSIAVSGLISDAYMNKKGSES